MKNKNPQIDRARYESFGGIVSSTKSDPPFLAWVDQNFMKEIGYEDSPLWREPNPKNYLSAPTEVHISVTNKCSAGCKGCYMNSATAFQDEYSTEGMKKNLKSLRDMGVFHVALGGGEAFERDDFKEIVLYAKEIGLVPNLTTNGQKVGEYEAEIGRHMGQINLSIDGIGERYGINGRNGSFEKAENAVKLFRKNNVQVGINCVVSRKNYPYLEDMIKFATKHKLNEVEFLRYKPQGRGTRGYEEMGLTHDMMKNFYPMLMDLAKKYNVEIKIDCSFVPAMVYHKPPVKELEKMAVAGCDGGNILLAVKSNGVFSGCSFVTGTETIEGIEDKWHSSTNLNNFRDLVDKAEEPCKSCDYLNICRTGCRTVVIHQTGNFFGSDPECPFVVEHREKQSLSAIAQQ